MLVFPDMWLAARTLCSSFRRNNFRWATGAHVRRFAENTSSGVGGKPDLTLNEVHALFAEARLLLQDADDSKGTIYFSEDFQDAKIGVKDTLNAYKQLLDQTKPSSERDAIRSANDPKFRQLAEEFAVLEEQLINDE